MPQYLLSVHLTEDDDQLGGEELEQVYADVDRFNTQLQDRGQWVFAGGLQPPSTATVVDGRGETLELTDGPFSEAKEQLGGFWVVEAPDLDAAIDLARQGSAACAGKVEVRPFEAE